MFSVNAAEMNYLLVCVSALIASHVCCIGGLPEGQPTHVDVAGLGRIHGITYLLPNGSVDVFLGIPFAKPPVGELRFRPPVPLDGPWSAEYNATRLPAQCFQVSEAEQYDAAYLGMWKPQTDNSEDCLYLNVWSPSRSQSKQKAVLVWIYGGGFSSGSASLALYDGSILSALGDVVVVSMQYRLGPLGFLALDDVSAPGNAGLLDQQLALNWVHQHIAAFGGDPDRVTLFGESAGAISASYHLLSPGSNHLFQSAIMQSGVATTPCCSVEGVEKASRHAMELAKLVGCSSVSKREALECLLQESAMKLTYAQWQVPVDGSKIKAAFMPSLDDNFFRNYPSQLLAAGQFQKKSILLGVNKNEGSFFLPFLFPDRFNLSRDYNDELTDDDYRQMVKQMNILADPHDAVVNALAFEYATECGSDEEHKYFSALDNMLGDYEFKCPAVSYANIYSRQSPVFLYTFNHRSSANPMPAWTGTAHHGLEIDLVFGRPWNPDYMAIYNDRERILSSRIINYWSNFAKNGDPNLNEQREPVSPDNVWPKYTSTERLVLILDTKDKLDTQTGLRDRSCQFLDNVLPQLQDATSVCYRRQEP